MRRSSPCHFAMLACVVLALSAGSAAAQTNPFPGTSVALTESDLAVIDEVAGGLIGGKVVPTGTKLHWFNGETHRQGTIEVLGSSELDGRPCHKLRYAVPLRAPNATRTYDLTWCRMTDGDWKIVSK